MAVNVLRRSSISQSIKICLYKTIIRPAVTYGAETWTVTNKIEKMLMTWERKIVRKIYGPTKVKRWKAKALAREEWASIIREANAKLKGP